jgi:Domain of unknown function (DUF4114)/Vanadium chloroperoxidase N-terminal domain
MQNLTGTAGADRFVIRQAGSTITGFDYAGGDRIVIDLEPGSTSAGIGGADALDAARATSSETLTNFDLINPLRLAGYSGPLTATATGVDVRIPDADGIGTQVFVTINTADLATATTLVTTLLGSTTATTVNSAAGTAGAAPGSSAFEVRSRGNTVVDWNDVTVDAARIAGVPPAASTRYFALVHAAINDAVQGITPVAGRQSYLQSQGLTLAAAPVGAAADVAAAAAASAVLTNLFTDTANPVSRNTPNGAGTPNVAALYPGIFNAALNSAIAQSREAGATQASIDAGLAYGNRVAAAISSYRRTDGYLRNATGATIDPASFNAIYKDGIENLGVDEAGGENNGTVGRLSNGTSLVGTGAPISTLKLDGTVGRAAVGATTPGAWRRGEDTLLATGTGEFSGLASPEVADVNQTWFLPKTSFFNDSVGSPPGLDSARYIDSVREVRAEGSLLDLPGVGSVSLANRTTTVNGVTSIVGINAAANVLGVVTGDANPADTAFPNAVGGDIPGNLPSTQPDGVGATSADRTVIAHVWANAEGSYGPNYAYQKIAQQLAINNNDNLATSAYRFAALDLALADGFANLWDTKWDEDYFWRPVSSIRNADQLAGTASLDDNNWTPREGTPQHPCHPSGTSATAGIATTLLASFYGENPVGGFTVSADVNGNSARLNSALISSGNTVSATDLRGAVNGVALEEVSRIYTSFSQAREETRLSRIYAGAHFRFATERGVQLGTNVANYFLANNPFLAPAPGRAPGLAATAPASGVFSASTAIDAVAQARWLASGARNYEFGSITVDNASGSIDGLTSDSAGYLALALNRKNVIFNGRSDASAQAISNSNLTNSERQSAGQLSNTNLIGNTIFYLTENGVTTLSNTGGSKFASASAGGLNQLTFKDSANQDVRFEVGAALPAFRTNGAPGGAATNVTINIARAAAFDNSVGIYAVDDAEGCFDITGANGTGAPDGIVDLRVGQAGYLAEALRRAALNPAINQVTVNGTSTSSTISLAAGQSFGLLLVSNGTIAAASAAGSTLNVFSSYAGANSDGINHIVRLGNGTTEVFGFEDQLGGGDRDFNDLIVNVTKV